MYGRLRKALPEFPQDLTTPGAVDRLLRAHRATFGPSRMEDDADKDTGDGGDGEDDDADADKDTEDGGGEDEDKPLGPAGQRAYEAEKHKRRKANAELREWKALGLDPAALKKLIDAQNTGGGKDGADAPDVERIKADAKADAAKELTRERVMDKIEAKGARLFSDPDDAAALLMRSHDHDDFLDENGKIDVEAIEQALKELLEKKPYLAVAQGDSKRFKGGADGGARKDSRPQQLTRDDLKRMSPQEIEKARTEGRLADLLGATKS